MKTEKYCVSNNDYDEIPVSKIGSFHIAESPETKRLSIELEEKYKTTTELEDGEIFIMLPENANDKTIHEIIQKILPYY